MICILWKYGYYFEDLLQIYSECKNFKKSERPSLYRSQRVEILVLMSLILNQRNKSKPFKIFVAFQINTVIECTVSVSLIGVLRLTLPL